MHVATLDAATTALKLDAVSTEIEKGASRHEITETIGDDHALAERAFEGKSDKGKVGCSIDGDKRLIELGHHDVGIFKRCRRPEKKFLGIEIDAPLPRVADLLQEIDRTPLLLSRSVGNGGALVFAADTSAESRGEGDLVIGC